MLYLHPQIALHPRDVTLWVVQPLWNHTAQAEQQYIFSVERSEWTTANTFTWTVRKIRERYTFLYARNIHLLKTTRDNGTSSESKQLFSAPSPDAIAMNCLLEAQSA